MSLVLFSSCKKQIVEVPIDAFLDLKNEVKFEDGSYTVSFTLQEYPYKEVGLWMNANRNSFHTGSDLTYCPTHTVAKNQYRSYLNVLEPNKTYYYQIFVKDPISSQSVYSEVFSFKTNLR